MNERRSEELMRRAIELSQLGFPAPNPRVGCVIAKDGNIVGEGYHDHAGGPHAEVVALADAGDAAEGADVFVTLEPCNHTGRTGPCSRALIQGRVRSVTYAVADPNPVAKGGATHLEVHGIPVAEGLLAEEAYRANQVYLTAIRMERPFVVLKSAVTLDGKIAHLDGTSKWITGEDARREGHRLRADLGGVLVGARTVEADNPLLTARIEGVVNQPTRVVLDPRRRLANDFQVFYEGARTLRVVGEEHATAGDLAVPLSGGKFPLDVVLKELWKHGINGLLVEGGGTTVGSFISAGLFERLELFVAPKLMGEGIPWASISLEKLSEPIPLKFSGVQQLGSDLRITAEPRR